jgi:hypothetical protein
MGALGLLLGAREEWARENDGQETGYRSHQLQTRVTSCGTFIMLGPYGLLSHGGHLVFVLLSLALKSLQSRQREAEQFILFSWD